ncbi:hypothetical protein E2C01_088809 [Portunus trituberculatus]|uniref:Uncharacterized protein n=1 Tax=Portunus trituberculatus TaxID=210409 RepID=A0A5B7J758_PORTR|nr:hypothetical protein [Portunus trituberculatus]
MTLMPLKTSDHLLFGKREPGGVAGRGRWSSPGAAVGRGQPGWRNWYTERQACLLNFVIAWWGLRQGTSREHVSAG